ncbi:MAG: tetratricopeptide repeat protein, partial [Gammaproteobacteria bacterium]|nr:tetratricopeptide repeat protein [Gammaproteobacteria bacterium]
MKPHAFVAMPFGTKPGPDGLPVDFNRVYAELIRPALEQAGLTAFRADEETRPGDIRVDMFQELLIADLVVVDITI